MAQVGQWGHETALAAPPVLAEGYTRLRRAGHYAGGSLKYGGEWFVGLDRVAMLEERLARDLELPPQPSVLARRPAEHRPPARLIAGDGPVPVEAWVSFRSPYSYLALDRLAALADELPIELRLRPVLPMVQRGHSMPTVKRLALVQDAAREAARLGVPFGQLADPLGAGVERCLAVAKLAIDRGPGPGLAFLRSATRGIWAEARDLSSDGDLEVVVERAGLSWGDAQAALAGDAWRGWAAEHATDLATAGLWGVPSFRAGDYLTWGQDRVEHLADRLRRHVAATRTA
jgi:2-hydroxychromene-2-carboxylate isomerase